MNNEKERVLQELKNLPPLEHEELAEDLLMNIWGDFDWSYYHYNGTDVSFGDCHGDYQIIRTFGYGMNDTISFVNLDGEEVRGTYDVYDEYVKGMDIESEAFRQVEDTFEGKPEFEHYGEFSQIWFNTKNGCITHLVKKNEKGEVDAENGTWVVEDNANPFTLYHHDLSVHPALEQLGYESLFIDEFTTDFFNYDTDVIKITQQILTDPIMQTICKRLGLHNALEIIYNKEYLAAYKVANRHKYGFTEPKKWMQLLHELSALKKDIRNPHFICPTDIDAALAATNQELERKRAKRERERRREVYLRNLERERLEREMCGETTEISMEYVKHMGKFFNLVIEGGGFTMTPLKSVMEFKEEADFMHHCVFRCGYYRKFNNLIVSVRDANGDRVSTIGFDLNTKHIFYNNSVHNSVPKKDNEIRKIFMSHLDEIMALKAAM